MSKYIKILLKSILIWILVFFIVSIILVGRISYVFDDGIETLPSTVGVHSKQYSVLGISYLEAIKTVDKEDEGKDLGTSYSVRYTNGAYLLPALSATLILGISLSYEFYRSKQNNKNR